MRKHASVAQRQSKRLLTVWFGVRIPVGAPLFLNYYIFIIMLADIPDYDQRIQRGKDAESTILNAFRNRGIKIDPATPHEDKHLKIDGWWYGGKKRYAVQVKFRESGDDILFELIKDFDRGVFGRDFLSQAEVYLVADRMGTVRMYSVKQFKEFAEKLIEYAFTELEKDATKTNWAGKKWEMKMQVDRAHGQRKLMAYFEPDLFKPLKEWDLKLKL